MIAGATAVRPEAASTLDDCDTYRVVISDGVPVLHLEPAGSPDDAWRLELDMRGVACFMPSRHWVPEFEEADSRPPPQPSPPPPSRPPPSTPPTRARAPRTRRTGTSMAPTAAGLGSGSAPLAGGAEGDEGGEDPDPAPCRVPPADIMVGGLVSPERRQALADAFADLLFELLQRGVLPDGVRQASDGNGTMAT